MNEDNYLSKEIRPTAPTVSIVGRPNVGKSTLFNRLAGRQISIVDSTSGVTRDRLSTLVQREGISFLLNDTGGVGIEDADALTSEVENQVRAAIEESNALLFVVDVRDGVTPLDERAADIVRRSELPTLLVVNKAERPDAEIVASEFYRLGIDEMTLTSAREGTGTTAILEWIERVLPLSKKVETLSTEPIKLALVGRRNVGKSTLVNATCGDQRVIVSDVPGTTRDAVDVWVQRGNDVFILVDTAGMRRGGKYNSSVEFYGKVRAEKSIRRADVVALVLDATNTIAHVDKHLAAEIVESYKPCLLVLNKWDLADDEKFEAFVEYVRKSLPGLSYAPMCFVSALTGDNVLAPLELAKELYAQASVRVSTGELNRVIQHAQEMRRPKQSARGLPRIYYATQIRVRPPTIVLFTNIPEGITSTYKRFLANVLRKTFDFKEVPIRLLVRAKSKYSRHANH